MADLTVTAAQVIDDPTFVEKGTAGEAIDAGELVYKDATASGAFKLADCDDSAATAAAYGIAVNTAEASGQPLSVQKTGGEITLGAGAAMTVGEIYLASDTAGKLAPEADISTQGDYVSIIGVAKSASVLTMGILNSGSQIP
jgi:hypothetical protein